MSVPKIALVVGQTEYTGASRLHKAAIEAEKMAEELAKCGYHVIGAFNVTRGDFIAKLTDLANSVKKASAAEQKPLVLFYYAGHGAEYQHIFRMLTTEYEGSTGDVHTYSVGIDEALRYMKLADRCVLILDACRINPTPGATEGREVFEPPQQGYPPLFWAYACWNDSETPDKCSFTSILLQELFKPGVMLIDAVGQANARRKDNAGPAMSQYLHLFNFSVAKGYDAAASSDTSLVGPPAYTTYQVAEFAAEELQDKAHALEQSLRDEAKVDKNYCMIVVENRTQWELRSPSVQYNGGFGELFPGCRVESIEPMTGAVFAFQPNQLYGGSNGLIKYSIAGSASFFYLQWNRPGPEGHNPEEVPGFLQKTFVRGAKAVSLAFFRSPTRPCWKAVIDSRNLTDVASTGEHQINVPVSSPPYMVRGRSVRVIGKMENVCTGLSKLWVQVAPAE